MREDLIAGFQKENEKLVESLRDREASERTQKALFFDQQETMNKELNRLRNLLGLTAISPDNVVLSPSANAKARDDSSSNMKAVGMRKSADALRAELTMEATARALRSELELNEAMFKDREKELKGTIEKLRAENKELIDSASKAAMSAIAQSSAAQTEGEVVRKKMEGELQGLRSRLNWYIENQELLEHAEQEKQKLRTAVSSLKQELVNAGYDTRTVAALALMDAKGLDITSNDGPGPDHSADESGVFSRVSGSSGVGAGTSPVKGNRPRSGLPRSRNGEESRRAPADVKRIK